jgi:hypothetical protein
MDRRFASVLIISNGLKPEEDRLTTAAEAAWLAAG